MISASEFPSVTIRRETPKVRSHHSVPRMHFAERSTSPTASLCQLCPSFCAKSFFRLPSANPRFFLFVVLLTVFANPTCGAVSVFLYRESDVNSPSPETEQGSGSSSKSSFELLSNNSSAPKSDTLMSPFLVASLPGYENSNQTFDYDLDDAANSTIESERTTIDSTKSDKSVKDPIEIDRSTNSSVESHESIGSLGVNTLISGSVKVDESNNGLMEVEMLTNYSRKIDEPNEHVNKIEISLNNLLEYDISLNDSVGYPKIDDSDYYLENETAANVSDYTNSNDSTTESLWTSHEEYLFQIPEENSESTQSTPKAHTNKDESPNTTTEPFQSEGYEYSEDEGSITTEDRIEMADTSLEKEHQTQKAIRSWSDTPTDNRSVRNSGDGGGEVTNERSQNLMALGDSITVEKVPCRDSCAGSEVSSFKKVNSTRKKIAILGLFEMTNKHGERVEGRSEVAAARLAIRHINEGSPERRPLIPGYELELLTNDTKCDPGVGVDAFFHALYTRRRGVGVGVGRGEDGGKAKSAGGRMVSLLGTACSEVTESLAKVVPYWNILQVSYGSTSPALSDRREFPLFYRTVAPDSSHNPARLAFVRRFRWDTVTALSQNEDVFSLAVNDLVTQLERANVSCRATITFGENDFKVQLRMLRDTDTRIIIGGFSPEVAPKIFCEAYRLGMYGSDYAWILQGSPADTWWWGNSSTPETSGCSAAALAAAVEGLLLVSSHNSIVGDDTPSYSGLTNVMFAKELAAQSLPVTKYAPQAYDAVWAIALALHHGNLLKRAADFDYHQRDLAREFLRSLSRVHFLGVSGPVSFSGADRVGISAFYQIQGGQVKKLALFYPEAAHLDFDCPQCVPPIWQGGQVPIAKRVFKVRVVTIDPVAFMSISCLAILGICLAFAFLGFNLYFRKLKYIKLSSPKLNNMAVIGCILVYMAVILLGLDHATLPEGNFHFAGICTARAYLLSAGFSLAFGSMFTKTYRVHRIFTRSRSGVVKNKMLQDTQLMSLICCLLLMDGLMVTLWVSVDPMQRHLKNLSLEISTTDRSVVYQPQVEVCRSQHTHGWLGALYVYKGLLLVAGLYMAWETRRVQIPALNDSQYIGASVYSVVITSVIVVVLANLISDRATLAFVTITALIFASTTTTLCLLFVPKIHTIWVHQDGDPIVESMGLKIECNTRRFVIDEKREMYYRVEVQNRVYRRELAALDLDISRLERQLTESPEHSTSTNSACGSPKKVPIVEEESEIQTEISNAEPSNEGETDFQDKEINSSSQTVHLQVTAPPAPRASWPSADPGPRRHVSFGSQPDLDERRKVTEASSTSAIPLPTSSSSSSSTHAPSSVLKRLLHFTQLAGGEHHGSRFSKAKKGLAGTSASGAVAAALRHHVKYVANLVPAGTVQPTVAPEIVIVGKPPTSRSGSVVFAEPIISITHNGAIDHDGRRDERDGIYIDDSADESEEIEVSKGIGERGGEDEWEEGEADTQDTESRSTAPRKFSLSACLSGDDDESAGTRGSPMHDHRHRRSHGNARPPPAPSFRERAKGSPRFPHKIVPAVACGSMGELRDWRGSNSSGIGSRVRLKPPPGNVYGVAKLNRRQPNLLLGPELPGKCRSLDASMDLPQSGGGGTESNRVLSKGICLRCGGIRPRRSSSGTCSAIPGNKPTGNVKYDRSDQSGRPERAKCECLNSSRAASLSPNCDVWCVEQGDGLQDFIPLSELLVSSSAGPVEIAAKRTDSQC